MRRALLLAPAVGLLGLMFSGCSSLPKTAPNFGEIEPRIGTVTVMPPSFGLLKVGAFTGETVSSLTHDIEQEIKWATESIIDWSRYSLVKLEADDQTLAQDPELRSALFAQSAATTKAFTDCAQTSGRKIMVDYGADIDYFADRTGSDYFIFVRGGGFFKTTGAQLKEAVVSATLAVLFGGGGGMGPGSATTIEVIVVDANKGKVIWYNKKDVKEKDPRRPSHLFTSCKAAFDPLVGPIPLKADKSQDQRILAKYKDVFGAEAAADSVAEAAHPNLKEEEVLTPAKGGIF